MGFSVPDAPILWTLEEALVFTRALEPLLNKAGWSLGIAGSVLLHGQSSNDLDLIVYPLNNGKIDRDGLQATLQAFGMLLKHDSIVVHQAWRRQRSTDRKHVEVWETKDGKRVDVFVLT